jgi:glycosyltransferase involved in cell wall biosynthesis
VSSGEKFSIVIPAFNEFENVSLLAREIDQSLCDLLQDWECIWVDDGSTDKTWHEILKLRGRHRGIRLNRNYGQSTAIMAGIDVSRFEVVVTIDADLQNNPADILAMLSKLDNNIDVVNGYRVGRQDKLFSRKIPSYIANLLARKISGVQARDLGCTLRVFRKRIVLETRLMGEMHRVLPIHFRSFGAISEEYPTNHRARIYGKSKYGLGRSLKFLADLLLAKILIIISSKPLYFFGTVALIIFLTSCISLSSTLLLRFLGVKDYIDGSLVMIGMVLLAISLVFIGLGLIGELVIRVLHEKDSSSQYRIREKS